MATSAVTIDPSSGERITPQIDPNTGERITAAKPRPNPLAPVDVTPQQAQDVFKAGVHSKMLGITPGTAYEGREEVENQLRSKGGNYDDGELDPTIANDIKLGLEGSIFGLHHREKLPDQMRNPGMVDKFVSGLSEMVADLPFYAVGGLMGGAAGGAAGSEVPIVGNVTGAALGAAAGGFALPSALREVLTQGIKNGQVKDFPDLLRRAGAVVWEGTKGAVVGAATELSGGVAPVIAKSGLATTAVKGLYQSLALTTSADLLEGHLPTAHDFASNAALLIPLGLITHGREATHEQVKQGAMDVYAKDGTTPQATAERLHAQPPVKPDLPPGLRPAIQTPEGHIEGDTGESHADVSERVLAKRPVTMDQLEADPAKADRVLQNPAIHEPDVIDKAWQLKSEAIDAGEVDTPSPEGKTQPGDDLAVHGSKETIGKWREEYRRRLDDPKLADEAKVVDYGDGTHALAVPVGEGRTSGSLDIDPEAVGGDVEHILEQLKDDPGFPNLRIENGEIQWGKKLTGDPGKAYGYSEKAREDFNKPTDINDLYDRNAMKSGRGFTTPDGQFLSLMEARKWVKDHEPDVHEMWLNEAGGDKQAELRSEAYAEARNRVQGRNVAEGEPDITRLSSDNTQRLAAARAGLNKIKAGLLSTKYGQALIRGFFSGQRDMRIAATTQLRDALKKIIPDYKEQQALTYLRDYKGSPQGLQEAIDRYEVGDNEQQKALNESRRMAQNPSPELLKADALMTDYYAKALDEKRQLGIGDSSIDPANYVPHDLMRVGEEGKGTGKRPMTTFTPRALERKHLTIDAAIDSGQGKLDARSVNALDLLSMYGEDHATVVASKLTATELKNTGLGIYGNSNKHPDGWQKVPGGAFQTTRAITDRDTGEAHIVSQDLYVPKDIADALKPMFEQGLAGTQFSGLLSSQAYVKALELGLSFFHVKALNITAFNNMGLAQFTKALNTDINTPEFAEAERGWAADGLTTAKTQTPYEAYAGLKKSSIPTGFDKFANAPVIKQADALAKSITDYTFEVVQRKFKVMDASMKEASWMAKHPDLIITPEPAKGMTRLYHGSAQKGRLTGAAWFSTDKKYAENYRAGAELQYADIPTKQFHDEVGYDPNDPLDAGTVPPSTVMLDIPRKPFKSGSSEEYFAARRSIAKEVNSAYGGLNWDVLGVGKTVRDVTRLALLAPDWTFSNVLTAKYAFEGGPAGSAARMFWAKSLITGFAMTGAMSIAIGGKWDPTDAKHFDQVYLGKDKDGKDMYGAWFFAGAPKDMLTLIKRSISDTPIGGTAEFIVSKASPAATLIMDEASNKRGASNIPVRDTKDTGLEQTGEALKYAAGRVVPITGESAVQTVERALTDPNHEYDYKDLLELAADTLGSPTTHAAPPKGESSQSSTKRFQQQGRGKSRFSIRSRK